MRKSKKGGQQGGHSSVAFTLEYRGIGCAVGWAEGPGEVAPFDWTRQPSTSWTGDGLTPFGFIRQPNYQDALAVPVPADLQYPRLARAHPFSTGVGQTFPVYRVFRDLWKLAEKDGGGPGPRFRKGVLEAVPRVGLLDPYGKKDTLEDWWKASFTVHGLLEILAFLELCTDVKRTDWDGFLEQWDWKKLWDGYGHWKPETWTRRDLKAVTAWRSFLRLTEGTAHAVRNTYAQGLFEDVPLMLREQMVLFRPGGRIWVCTGSLKWAMFELANLFSAGQRRQCAAPDCKLLFIGSRRYCSSTCEERTAKQRKRNRVRMREGETAGIPNCIPEPKDP